MEDFHDKCSKGLDGIYLARENSPINQKDLLWQYHKIYKIPIINHRRPRMKDLSRDCLNIYSFFLNKILFHNQRPPKLTVIILYY